MKRDIILKLHQWNNREVRKPLIIKGARQVGKTYILKQFGQKAYKRYHYINFEEDESLNKIFEKDLKVLCQGLRHIPGSRVELTGLRHPV